jgi:hypothetical protein
MNSQESEKTKAIPEEIEKRLNDYHKYFRVARTLHYSIGVFGLTCSLLATSGIGGGDAPRYWAVGSGVCFGLLAFVDPNSKYLKFSQAARVLDSASLEYKYANLPISDLIQSFKQAEEIITGLEKLETTSQEQLNQARGSGKKEGEK